MMLTLGRLVPSVGTVTNGQTQDVLKVKRTGLAHGLDVCERGREAEGSLVVVGWRGHL